MISLLRLWVRFQRRNLVLFLALLAAVVAAGAVVAYKSEIQAFPELTNVQVQVITQYPGKAAEEVERRITVPLEVATNGLSNLINQRSISLFGLSVITLTFDDEVKGRQARLDVADRLRDVDLPEGVKARLSPDSTPVGEVFRYAVSGPMPLDELRMIEDWTLEREFKSIQGVADVVSFGGPARTIEVKIDSARALALGLNAATVAQALGQNHANAGGGLLTHGEETFVARSLGLYERPENLEQAVVSTQKNTPVRVADIGSVGLGFRPRLGQVGRNSDEDVVEGIILLRQGADTLATCAQIRKTIDRLNESVLPSGVKISAYYDRTTLIGRSSRTVFHNIGFGIGLVCLVLVMSLGLRYWQLIFGVALIIPFALLTAFLGMKLCGYAPNLISLGAVDFGIIVETAIFAAEALIMALVRVKRNDEETVAASLAEVFGPALICALLLLIAFIPILSLQRVEGRIFKPLGITLVSALIGGQLGAMIFIPLFGAVAPVSQQRVPLGERMFAKIVHFFALVSRQIARIPRAGVLFGGVLFAGVFLIGASLGREFLPQLNEGALYIRATAPPTISREASAQLASEIRLQLKKIPEVIDAVSQIGRPDDGTDVNGFDNVEILVSLVPPDEWQTAQTTDGFIAAAQGLLAGIKGVNFNFSQPIKDNVDEAISGVKGELVVKVFGPKLDELQKYADQIERIIRQIPGADDVAADQLLNQPEVRFTMNRDLLARYGLRVADAEDVLESALMGKFAAKMTDEQGRSVDILVKPDIPEHPTTADLGALPVMTATGAKISLSDVASPTLAEGVTRVYREGGERRVAVKCSVRGRAVVDFVKEASAKITADVKLADKYRIQWSGSFENAERASSQLAFIAPLCLLAILVILYTWFRSWRCVGYILWEIPFALIGGLAALKIAGLNLSISAAAGGIVLIGVSFLSAMMLVSEWLHSGSAWEALREKGRSILISNGVAIVGLIPAAFSHGIGSETARPFAVIILGGLVTSLAFSLTLLPAVLSRGKTVVRA